MASLHRLFIFLVAFSILLLQCTSQGTLVCQTQENNFYNWYSERSFNFYISTFFTLKYTVEEGVNIRARRIKSKSKICISVQINSASNSISNSIDYSCNQH